MSPTMPKMLRVQRSHDNGPPMNAKNANKSGTIKDIPDSRYMSATALFFRHSGASAASSQANPESMLSLARPRWIPGSARKQRGRPRNDDNFLLTYDANQRLLLFAFFAFICGRVLHLLFASPQAAGAMTCRP
ncbi:MAG: hypothetical protein EPN36_01825 [Rhodanobacteraceae bacterium]|nr:MAG: hypothetical protein EPN36_01825 [Rhodanobacteraceae bacterium]